MCIRDRFWQNGPGEAKVDAGEMILNGEQHLVETKLSYARQDYAGQGLCSFTYEGYSYEDMVAVADYWQTRSVYDAKVSINNKLESGLHREVKDVVQAARLEASRTVHRTERIAFQGLNRDGKNLGYFIRSSDGSWVEMSAAGEPLFFFREVAHNPFETTLVDDSRGMVINLDHHMNVIRYKWASGHHEFQDLYAMTLPY